MRPIYAISKLIWAEHKYAIGFVYLLSLIEQICYLLIPAAVGLLIDSFIYGKGYGVLAFTLTYVGWHGTSTYRQIKDTIVFTELFNQFSMRIIDDHLEQGIGVTKINARVEMMNEVVDFFEYDLPFVVNSVVSVVGSSVLLYFYNPKLLIVSVLIILPSSAINFFYAKRIMVATNRYNNQYERQVEVIEHGSRTERLEYFRKLRELDIKKSTLEALNFGLLEVFVFVMIITSIYIICRTDEMDYGSIVASYGIILRFAYGFDFIPHTTTRLATMKDVLDRIRDSF